MWKELYNRMKQAAELSGPEAVEEEEAEQVEEEEEAEQNEGQTVPVFSWNGAALL